MIVWLRLDYLEVVTVLLLSVMVLHLRWIWTDSKRNLGQQPCHGFGFSAPWACHGFWFLRTLNLSRF